MTAIAEYVQDYETLIEGIEFCLQLEQEIHRQGNLDALRSHYEKHPEDKLCQVYRPGSQQMVLCRRAGIEAIARMAARLVDEAEDGQDLSKKRIAEIISRKILQVGIDGVTDDAELVRILKTYVEESKAEHIEASYWFPCILLHECPPGPELGPPVPDRLALGPVQFTKFALFAQEFAAAVEKGAKRADEKAFELFAENAKEHGWVAHVSIPRCAQDVSRARAEEVIEAAINLIKVFIGLGYGRSMRLPHTAPARNRQTCVLADVQDRIEWTWHGRTLEGALVAGDPLAALPEHIRTFASDLLGMSLPGRRHEVTTRVLDALKWFGDASFEESAGVQIVKWVAGLERLTGTERLDYGITRNFCNRVALLASGLGSGNVEQAFRDSFRAYDLRCEVMHGARSQNDEHLAKNMRLVHELTRAAICGALSLHHVLSTRMNDGRRENMGKVYDQFVGKYDGLFERVYRQLRPLKPRPRKARRARARR